VHELAHLYLGHLGPDKHLGIPNRSNQNHKVRELEAESVSYLVCSRNGVHSNSESYLADYVTAHETVENLDLYSILKAAGKVEVILELGEISRFGPK
jgi:antirestriction protein ArdC